MNLIYMAKELRKSEIKQEKRYLWVCVQIEGVRKNMRGKGKII
jgi:hypothetical protein